jgi:chromate transport protein ChrA
MDWPTPPRAGTPVAWAAGIALALPLAVILTIDVLALRTPFTARLGLVSWGLLLAAIAALAIADALDLARSGLTGRRPLTLIATAFVVAVLISAVGDSRVVSQEGAIELRCIAYWLAEDPRLGFWRTCLFGYPARQT